MRFLFEYNQLGPPPSRWRNFWQQAFAWVILVAGAALVVTLTVLFFSAIASLVAVLVVAAVIAAVVLRIKYRKWWPTNRR